MGLGEGYPEMRSGSPRRPKIVSTRAESGGASGQRANTSRSCSSGERAMNAVTCSICSPRSVSTSSAIGELLVSCLAGALQGAVDRGDSRLECVGDLCRRETEHFAKDQHSALIRGEMLERRYERQLDALAQLIPRLWRSEAIVESN